MKEFKYSGYLTKETGGLEIEVTHRIQVGWTNWKRASLVLCDRRATGNAVVRPAITTATTQLL